MTLENKRKVGTCDKSNYKMANYIVACNQKAYVLLSITLKFNGDSIISSTTRTPHSNKS